MRLSVTCPVSFHRRVFGMDLPEVKDKDGKPVELAPVKSVKLKRSGRDELEKFPWYANGKGDWFVELDLIRDYVRS
jgi:hypothetical protein